MSYDQMSPAEECQLRLIYAAVFVVLGYESTDVAELQKTMLAEIRSIPFQVVIKGYGGSGSVKYGDRYPPLAKCITAFKSNITGIDIETVREWWLWIGRDSHDYLLRRYIRQFGSTLKICSCIGFAIKWQQLHNGKLLLERGEIYYLDKDPDYVRQFKMGKLMIIGVDKLSRPLVIVRTRLHTIKGQDRETMRRLDVLLAETCAILNSRLDGCTVIYDLTNYTAKNRDPALMKFGIQNFTKIYPGIMALFCLHNAPSFFKNNFKSVSSSLDPGFKSRIKFTNSTDDLLEFVNLEQIPKELGGTAHIDIKGWIPPRPQDDAQMQDKGTRDQLLARRRELLNKFNEGISQWINGAKFPDRHEISEKIISLYYELDPYVRSRTIWDRQGIVELCRPELRRGQSRDNIHSQSCQSPVYDGGSNECDSLSLRRRDALSESQDTLADPASASDALQMNMDGVFYGQDVVLASLPISDSKSANQYEKQHALGDEDSEYTGQAGTFSSNDYNQNDQLMHSMPRALDISGTLPPPPSQLLAAPLPLDATYDPRTDCLASFEANKGLKGDTLSGVAQTSQRGQSSACAGGHHPRAGEAVASLKPRIAPGKSLATKMGYDWGVPQQKIQHVTIGEVVSQSFPSSAPVFDPRDGYLPQQAMRAYTGPISNTPFDVSNQSSHNQNESAQVASFTNNVFYRSHANVEHPFYYAYAPPTQSVNFEDPIIGADKQERSSHHPHDQKTTRIECNGSTSFSVYE